MSSFIIAGMLIVTVVTFFTIACCAASARADRLTQQSEADRKSAAEGLSPAFADEIRIFHKTEMTDV